MACSGPQWGNHRRTLRLAGSEGDDVFTSSSFVEVWSETFATGIQGALQPLCWTQGTLGITYDAANGAVILDATGYNTAWMFNMPDAQLSVKLEFDIEIITPTYGNSPAIGLVLTGGPGLLQNIVSPGGTLFGVRTVKFCSCAWTERSSGIDRFDIGCSLDWSRSVDLQRCSKCNRGRIISLPRSRLAA